MAFDPKNLAPAATIEAFAKTAGARSTKQVAIDNIQKMIALYADQKLEGKRNYKQAGNAISFTVRVNNTAMDLEVYVNGKPALTKEPSIPADQFVDALNYYVKQIEDGKYDPQLKLLDEKRTARTDKMRTTCAAKPKGEAAKA